MLVMTIIWAAEIFNIDISDISLSIWLNFNFECIKSDLYF